MRHIMYHMIMATTADMMRVPAEIRMSDRRGGGGGQPEQQRMVRQRTLHDGRALVLFAEKKAEHQSRVRGAAGDGMVMGPPRRRPCRPEGRCPRGREQRQTIRDGQQHDIHSLPMCVLHHVCVPALACHDCRHQHL